MAGLNAGLIAIASQLALLFDGVCVLCMIGVGFYYVTARGNPRGQQTAFTWLVDIGKGLAIGLGATGITQMLTGNLHFG